MESEFQGRRHLKKFLLILGIAATDFPSVAVRSKVIEKLRENCMADAKWRGVFQRQRWPISCSRKGTSLWSKSS
jgi:hypothetical protein